MQFADESYIYIVKRKLSALTDPGLPDFRLSLIKTKEDPKSTLLRYIIHFSILRFIYIDIEYIILC